MKTLTITLHSIDNCGSCLQAYALQQFLIQNGIDNEIIDYRPAYGRNNGRPVKHLIKKLVFGRAMKRRWEVFHGFVRNYLKMTDRTYYRYSELEQADLAADVFITGSDQVWNDSFPCGRDDAFYLKFVKKGKKISYAASVGRVLHSQEEISTLCGKLQEFDAISVREQSSADMLNKAGVYAQTVCDPVLLHDREFYETMLMPNELGDYILVYLIPKSELLNQVLAKIKAKYDCKVVYVGSFLNHCECDINLTDVGPKEFLNLIAHAKYIIAGSFHATVFSCIFHKEFVTLPYANNARMKEFLALVGLKERFVEHIDSIAVNIVAWENIDDRRKALQERSMKWIMEELGGGCSFNCGCHRKTDC